MALEAQNPDGRHDPGRIRAQGRRLNASFGQRGPAGSGKKRRVKAGGHS